MSVAEAIDSVKFVVDQEGHRTAAMLDIAAWDKLIDWIEDIVDAKQAADILTQLGQHEGRPQRAGWLPWDQIRKQWIDDASVE